MKDLVLKSSQWLRGIGGANSALRRGDKYCCLGIHGLQLGVGPSSMLNVTTPYNLPFECKLKDIWTSEDDGHMYPSALADLATVYNDTPIGEVLGMRESDKAEALRLSIPLTPILSDEDRVERLRPIFAEVGWNLVWRPDL